MPKTPSSTASDREIVITRVVNAPRDLVWTCWTEPQHLDKWWGPNGFTVTTLEIDIREGGTWRFIMHGPDPSELGSAEAGGTDYPNHIVFTEITKPERIAHDHGGDDGKVHFQAVVTFEEQGNKTVITMTSLFPSTEERDRVIKEYGAIEGGKQTLGRMAVYAEQM